MMPKGLEPLESLGTPGQSLQEEVKRFRQPAQFNGRRDGGHLSELANRGHWHDFKGLQNCIVWNQETLIFRSILGFWLILQNGILPHGPCYVRVGDGIRPENLCKCGVDSFGFG
jgi:hypothetical protein